MRRHDASHPLRVALLPERIGRTLSPCASIRLHAFLDHLADQGALEYRSLLVDEVGRFAPDVALWHRGSLGDPGDIEVLQRQRAVHGTRLVYDLDDNLLDLDTHGERGVYERLKGAVRASLAVADDVWCSTPALSARVASERAGPVRVLVNALSPRIWRMRPPVPAAAAESAQPLELLYMGTRTHADDFEIIAQAMDLVESSAPGSVRLTVIGVREHDRNDRPWLQVRSTPDFVGASYPGFVHWLHGQGVFDAGVAPLVANDFNACKSHIKVLDYAAMGLPTIASNVRAYADALVDGTHCLLTDNSAHAWAAAINAFIHQPTMRDELARGAARLVGDGPFELAARQRHDALLGRSAA